MTTIPPKYEGQPLSAVVPLPKHSKQEYPQLWIWADLWHRRHNINYSQEAIEQLEREGWKTAHGTFAGSLAALQTQLYETVRLVYKEPEERIEAWYKPEDGQDPAPVILAFSINKNPQPDNTIFMLNPLPLPQHGEYGLVSTGEDVELSAYYILDLPLEARQRWSALNDALNQLSAPLKWPQFTDRHIIASDEIQYRNQDHSLTVQQHLAIGNAKADLIIQGALLRSAHIHIEELRKALRKDDWQHQWNEIRRMARELAKDYYNHHLQEIKDSSSTIAVPDLPVAPPAPGDTEPPEPTTPPGTDPTEPTTQLELGLETGLGNEQQPAPVPTKKKRAYRSKATTPIVAKGQEIGKVKSDKITQEIIKALRDKTLYTLYPDMNIAEYRIQKEKGESLIISLKPLENEGWSEVLAGLSTLGDGCIDTYMAVMMIAIDRNGTEHIRTSFLISPDDILAVCGKKKSNGSYTAFQRAEVIKHLKTLSQARIIATVPGRPAEKRGPGRRRKGEGDPTILRAEGPIIQLNDFRIGEYSLITGEELWEKRSIAIGEWSTMIPELTKYTAIMLRQVLAYSAKNERYQKRLGVYLTLMFRNSAWHGGTFPHDISMGALLDGAGIIPDRKNPGRFKDAIMHALECLKQDGVIGDYWQVIDSSNKGLELAKEIHEQAYGWGELFLRQKWNFSPPEIIKNQYRKLLREPSKEGKSTNEETK